MVEQEVDGTAVRYAVRIGRRLRMSEREICSMVEALDSPFASVEVLALGGSGVLQQSAGVRGVHARHSLDNSVGAHVAAVARAYETLITSGHDREQALTRIKQHASTDLDPEVVGELLSVIREEDIASYARSSGGGESWGGSAA